MNQKTHILWTSANEPKNHQIILQWHGYDIQWQRQEIHRSNSSHNSWNMMSAMVRVGTMNEFQQNKRNTTIKQVMLPRVWCFRLPWLMKSGAVIVDGNDGYGS
jgi:hypothetical protein